MFKINKPEKEYDFWEITLENSDKRIATIEVYNGFRENKKQLKVNGKVITNIKNQKEALVELEKFFKENKQKIEEQNIALVDVVCDLSSVRHPNSIKVLEQEIVRIQNYISNLQEYDLI